METCQVFYTNSPRNTLTSMDITHSRTSAIVLNHNFLDFMITMIGHNLNRHAPNHGHPIIL